ncbi:MAG TPA: type I-B CRISPR-associated protein Cas5b [Saprospiraceae bacterium]|jgi:CRISPR-associated protein Cas5h|nr:type I-B CRISPR-associated protein Cas5b [Saprospiraceae bacterium]HMT71246.1 type I-B CRISPR-associated protein Cas5b [Saprospiraceae bacterium]
MQKLISVDFKADFGFFRKPDANNTINLSYNIAHKPAILGIFGAIIGMDGYQERGKIPEYYNKLSHIGIGITPLGHEKGNFQKTVIKYSNTVGYANKGSNYLTEEATLIKPTYRIYAILDLENEHEQKLYEYLRNGYSEFIPYFGKNEHYAWWELESFKDYEFIEKDSDNDSIFIKTTFIKENVVKDHKADAFFDMVSFMDEELPFMYFERLPKDFDQDLFQYNLDEYVLTTFRLNNSIGIRNLYFLKNENCYVQLI